MRTSCRHLLAASLALLLGATGCGDDYFLMHRKMLVKPEGETFAGGGCESVTGDESGSTSSGSAGDGLLGDVDTLHESVEGEVRVSVRVRGLLQVRRFYTEKFLATGRKDEILVPLDADAALRLTYWGGTACDESATAEE